MIDSTVEYSSFLISLLCGVLPYFIELSKYFAFSNDEEAIQARTRMRHTSAYARIFQELKDLSEVMQGLGLVFEHLDHAADSGMRISKVTTLLLDRLENLCSKSSKGLKLEGMDNLFTRLSTLQQQGPGMSLARLKKRVRLHNRSSKTLIATANTMLEFTSTLNRILDYPTLNKALTRGGTFKVTQHKPRRPLVANSTIREHAERTHVVIHRQWEPSGRINLTELSVATSGCTCEISVLQCQCSHATFDALFSAKNTVSHSGMLGTSYLRCTIEVLESGSDQHGAGYIAKTAGMTNWHAVKDDHDPIEAAIKCQGCLRLRLAGEELQYHLDQEAHLPSTSYPVLCQTQLHGIISNMESPFYRIMPRMERFKLAVLMARALVNFQSGPWLCIPLQAKHMQFLLMGRPAIPDLRVPWLSVSCRSARDDQPIQNGIWRSSIMSFGLLLLSMERGQFVAMEDLYDTWEYFQRELGNAYSPYFEAAHVCINLDFEGCSFEDKNMVQTFYAAVVVPLEEVLYGSFPTLLQESRNRGLTLEPTITTGSPMIESKDRTKRKREDEDINSFPSQSPLRPLGHTTTECNELCLHDDGNILRALEDPTEALEADNWFRDHLGERVHKFLQPTWDADKDLKIKIAILDTGVELPDEANLFYPDGPSIVECRSWLRSGHLPDGHPPDGGPDSGNIDEDGHGTHAAGILMDVAPCADLFVARTFRNRNEKQGPRDSEEIGARIAAAIRYAVDVWKVDMISMSFGFYTAVGSVHSAILHAYQQKVLLIAAAGNYGANREASWPATCQQVLGIHASTGNGTKFSGNPASCYSFEDRFTTLGVAVDSWWPRHLGGPRMRKTGTSSATPVAAGIAALVMHFLWSAEFKRCACSSTDMTKHVERKVYRQIRAKRKGHSSWHAEIVRYESVRMQELRRLGMAEYVRRLFEKSMSIADGWWLQLFGSLGVDVVKV